MSAKLTQTTRNLRQYFGMKAWNSQFSKFHWETIANTNGEIGAREKFVMQAILHSDKTARTTGTASMELRKLNGWTFTRLVGEIAENADIQNYGDVARYLNQVYQ